VRVPKNMTNRVQDMHTKPVEMPKALRCNCSAIHSRFMRRSNCEGSLETVGKQCPALQGIIGGLLPTRVAWKSRGREGLSDRTWRIQGRLG
jgi:hypothetical protein